MYPEHDGDNPDLGVVDLEVGKLARHENHKKPEKHGESLGGSHDLGLV